MKRYMRDKPMSKKSSPFLNHLSYTFSTVFMIVALMALSCQKKTEQPKVTSAPDTLMGDWMGKLVMADGVEQPLAAQVICYAQGKYQANMLQAFATRDSALCRLQGLKKNETIHFSGQTRDDVEWNGSITGKNFTGEVIGSKTGTFTLVKIERLSPTLGKIPPAGAHLLFDGSSLEQWEQLQDRTGYINLARFLGGKNCVTYIRTSLWSDSEQMPFLLLGSDDGIKVWLNDALVWSNNKNRGARPADDTIQVNLKQGWNTIQCKINNGDGGWGAYVKFVNPDGTVLSNIAEKTAGRGDTKSRQGLDKNDGYLTVWQVSGSFRQEPLKGEQLFDVPFPPEQHGGEWKDLDLSAVDYSARWKMIDGAMEVVPGSGSIVSKKKFTDFELHLEFRSPFMPDQTGQARGNSGVYIQGRYEVQVLDSYGLEGADNECGGIYKIARPRVNMCAPPTQWQTYDVTFKAARFDPSGIKTEPAHITVIHNGIPIYEDLLLPGPTAEAIDQNENEPGGIMLQDHGDLVQYRNVWIVEKVY
jgi:hypothetical protein